MLWHIKKALITLLNFSGSLATKSASLNKEPCITRSILIDLDSIEFN